MKRIVLAGVVSIALAMIMRPVLSGQQRGRGGRGDGPPPSAQQSAPVDLTGYWVSVVTEDWRWRMATPPKKDYQSLPINQAARAVADAWDLEKDNAAGLQCMPYGAGNIMRQPGRLHITWQDENTLKVEIDAGTQTRVFSFGAPLPAAGPKTWQGISTASWERPGRNAVTDVRVAESRDASLPPGGGGAGLRGAPPRSAAMFEGGSLAVRTTNFRDGYLRNNGVPYSENATLVEHFDRLAPSPNGDVWLVVSSMLEDPTYLTGPLYLSTQFKKEPNGTKWNPTPCHTDPPAQPRTNIDRSQGGVNRQ
jgi:hypothetical protein